MEAVINRSECIGCMACKNACPMNAIKIEEIDGFNYPIIIEDKCIGCNLCKKVCPILNMKKETSKEILAYACKNKNDEIRKNSSSGGVFSLIAEYILNNNGIVYGVAFNKDYETEHIRIDKVEDLEKIRGSKYIQSNLGDSYSLARKDLENGKLVLFTGTPCQIEGLKSFLGNDYSNLFLQDVICHGVPSKKIFKKYLENKIKKNGKINSYSFRNKENKGWNKYQICIKYDNKNTETAEEYIDHSSDTYMNFFLSDIALRESCYDCKFKKKYRDSDITLADFWGIDDVCPEMNDEKGTSLVILNSKKGQELFNKIVDKLEKKEVDIDKAINHNKSMIESPPFSLRSKELFEDIDKLDYDDLVKKYLN